MGQQQGYPWSPTTMSLDLCRLRAGLTAITSYFGGSLCEAAAVCFADQKHSPDSTVMQVDGCFQKKYTVIWPAVTDQILRCWNDDGVATEHGAYAVAILLILDLEGLTVIERSRKGTGFDFWLGIETDPPFQDKARLEVSGIRSGDSKMVHKRVKEKLSQTTRSAGKLPAYVVVVEFSSPLAHVAKS